VTTTVPNEQIGNRDNTGHKDMPAGWERIKKHLGAQAGEELNEQCHQRQGNAAH
jgi:hypothetical protein